MQDAAIYFWVGLAGLLAVAFVLGRWQEEDLARQLAEKHARLVVPEARFEARVHPDVAAKEEASPEVALPGRAERASA